MQIRNNGFHRHDDKSNSNQIYNLLMYGEVKQIKRVIKGVVYLVREGRVDSVRSWEHINERFLKVKEMERL